MFEQWTYWHAMYYWNMYMYSYLYPCDYYFNKYLLKKEKTKKMFFIIHVTISCSTYISISETGQSLGQAAAGSMCWYTVINGAL